MDADEPEQQADAQGPAVEVAMSPQVLDLLRSLTRQVAEVLDGDVDRGGPIARQLAARLYPSAGQDAEVDAAVRSLVHDDVMVQRHDDLAALGRLLADGAAEAATQLPEGTPDENPAGEAPPETLVRFQWNADEAGSLLRATHAITLALALQQDPEVFERDAHGDQAAQDGQPETVPDMLMDLLHELHGVVLAQLDPDSLKHATSAEDGPS